MNAAQYRARIATPRHPLADCKLYWRSLFFLDVMHILDCKGVAATIYGSLLSTLVRDSRLGPSQQARLRAVNAKLVAFYGRRPGAHRLPTLTLANLTNADGWRELSGPAIKAANTRAAAPFFAELAMEYYNDDAPAHRDMCRVTRTLSDMYDIMKSSPMFLDAPSLGRFQTVVSEFGVALQRLRAWAEDRHELSWQVRPKAHKTMHLPFIASVINPRSVSNYADESQIGTTTRVWKGSVSGRYKAHVQRIVLAKRLRAVLLRYERG